MRRGIWAALTGIVAAATVLASAELVALFVGAESSPLFAVGSLVIDLAPPGVKELTISLFGTGDKAALLTILGVVVAVGAALAGWLEYRRRPVGTVILVVFSAIAVLAVTTRQGASGISAVPTVVGMLVGVVMLNALQTRLRRWVQREDGARARAASPVASAPLAGSGLESDLAPEAGTPALTPAPRPDGTRVIRTGPAALERRQFLTWMIVAAAASAIVGAGARVMNAGAAVVTAARNALVLPAASTPAAALPAGTDLGITNLSPVVTPAADFYRIDTALQVPQLNPDTWSLTITGMVENEIEISFADLLALPLVENYTTLTCVSNEVGGDLIGNALWLGYPIRDLLARAKPTAGADMVLSRSSDGFTAGTPLEVLQDTTRDSLLAVGMNGEPLPVEHGFPVRMVVPGLYGYVSATKWVVEMKVTTFAADMGYWTPRGWTALGPIKTSSRIDTPRQGGSLAAGTIPIAGVAWAQHTGVQGVEVQIDGGDWQQATLAEAISADTWRQWVLQWDAPSGDHTIAVRATDDGGYTQTSDQAPPAPDGSTGWHTIKVSVN
ncbi:oxidoreductase [Subtercola boreus]|uniref:Oxidoreductase n=1 Tax=Subtercola boreus TaxID=120213 RepID=A0A3E0VLS1_9MICO|nr:molybdopterin-dependent oxidoreductase [Subtercola boreus]RFA10615.1 oxidoreductase [Subtercola boreus]TQL55831.1 DMSO/TMAO reductase YedYZ molybdopterin-dependent catalytic subunit [Subtercola boreus]